jgi:hypothetical protein
MENTHDSHPEIDRGKCELALLKWLSIVSCTEGKQVWGSQNVGFFHISEKMKYSLDPAATPHM